MDNADLLKHEISNTSIINLESLLNLSAKLNEVNDEQFILNSSILSLMGKLRMVRSCVLINQDSILSLFIAKGRKPLIDDLPFGDDNSIDMHIKLLNSIGYDYIFPVSYNKQLLAVICLGNRFADSKLSSEELRYAELLTQITANAIQNARSHNHLRQEKINTERRNQLLTTLFEVTRDFSNLLSRKQIIQMLSYHLMGQLMVNKFAVLIEINNSYFEPLINRFTDNNLSNKVFVQNNKGFTSVLLGDDIPPEIKFLFPNAQLVSPMIVQGKTKGFLLIGKSMSGKDFDDMNMHFISALGNTAMASIENERLFQEELIKISMENELVFALEIQKNLLPKEVPFLRNFDLAGRSIPSRHVGGDYFDFIKLSETRIMLAIADVSGKGMPASLIMANVQAALRVLAPLNLSLSDLIFKLNNLVFVNTASDKFITFFLGILDTDSSQFDYINAGHNPPILYKSDSKSFVELSEGGLILGIVEDNSLYDQGSVVFEDGDSLLMYTDGITESIDENYNDYGEGRLRNCFKANLSLSAEELVETVIQDVSKFFANHHQYDDLTLIVLSRKSK